MNKIFYILIALSFGTAAVRQLAGGEGGPAVMDALSQAITGSAGAAVQLALGLIGTTTFFLGLMKVAEAGGLLAVIARLLRPLMVRLFPEVPAQHPAMGAMIMNVAANVLGLGNAATPFGIRAMQELDKLNPHKGTATNAMVLFLAINTSSVTLLPTGVIALRAAAGSSNPAGIVATTLVATICSTVVAVVTALTLARWFPVPAEAFSGAGAGAGGGAGVGGGASPATGNEGEAASGVPAGSAAPDTEALPPEAVDEGCPPWVSWLSLAVFFSLIPLTLIWGRQIAPWIIPTLAIGLLTWGAVRKVPVYEVFIEGAREGFQVALRIIPYLVAILVAVAMFRASGAMDWIVTPLGVLTAPFGLPAEALPMALLRPLSGSGAYGLLASLIQDPAVGPDSYLGYLVSTIQGSTETTFYVLAVYFGAVNIRRSRHAVAAGIAADVAGVAAAVAICSWLYG